jgi:hypothetical protein
VPPSTTTRCAAARALRLLSAGLCCLSLVGCAGFWDDFTAHDFSLKQWFSTPDPLVVLKDSAQYSNGNLRYKALASLQEPLQHGGTEKEQEAIFQILEVAATKDEAPLCRLAALSSLGHFKDPRAAQVIDSVYLQQLPFTKEINTRVKEQCLTALIETGGPIAQQRLILVAKEPPAISNSKDYQETLDRQLVAIRGLANFKTPDAEAALAYVLCTKKNDIALRDRAHQSLVTCTGKDLPADSTVWSSYLGPEQPVQPTGGSGARAPGATIVPTSGSNPAPQAPVGSTASVAPPPAPSTAPATPAPSSGPVAPPPVWTGAH